MKATILLALTLLAAIHLDGAEFTRESLLAEIGTMKTLLTGIDVEKAKAFITTYSHPDELKAHLATGTTVDAAAKSFVEESKAAVILALFDQLDVVNVEIHAEERIIICKHKDPDNFDKIRFAFVKGSWFLMN
jgi:hypothetical protein